jgi:DNA-binding transcriptional MerR regulator
MKLFFSSEEVASHFSLPVSTIEHYIRFFNLKINKVGKNRRYDHANMEALGRIVQLVHTDGHTLEGAKEKLKSKQVTGTNTTNEVIQRLLEVKKTLLMIKEKIG